MSHGAKGVTPRDAAYRDAALPPADVLRHARRFSSPRRHQERDHASSSFARGAFWRKPVAQVSKPAVSPISKSAELGNRDRVAGLETRDTAD